MEQKSEKVRTLVARLGELERKGIFYCEKCDILYSKSEIKPEPYQEKHDNPMNSYLIGSFGFDVPDFPDVIERGMGYCCQKCGKLLYKEKLK